MSVWHWFLAAGMAALVVWEIAVILGPFELDDAAAAGGGNPQPVGARVVRGLAPPPSRAAVVR